MKIKLKKLALITLTLCLLLIFYTVFLSTEKRTLTKGGSKQHISPVTKPGDVKVKKAHVVEIWGKAAIGLFLWEHILNAKLEERLNGVWSYGETRLQDVTFRFRTGPGVVPTKVPQDVEHLILVLNGREPEKVKFAQDWLGYLPNLINLQNVAVVLLGNEQCNNEWVKPYLTSYGGLVKFIFLVYDSPEIDDHNFYQWPLGVATYRNFPKAEPRNASPEVPRKYKCNFMGTVYPGSSRVDLLRIIAKDRLDKTCYIKPRHRWLPEESAKSRSEYIQALMHSDLTLNPVGKNTECYRIYEAISYGSVPVIEDKMTSGNCGKSASHPNVPLSLLKEHKAPVIFISDWKELPLLLEEEESLTQKYVLDRRLKLLKWYSSFKNQMKNKFLKIIQRRFFNRVN